MGERLARVAERHHVHRADALPVDRGDVAEVRHVGPVAGEHAGGVLVELGERDRVRAHDLLDGQVEPAEPGAQRQEPHRCPSSVE
jgi:hypothetical protein